MNGKIIFLAVASLSVAILVTPLISSVQAEKTVVPFSLTGGITLLASGEVHVKWTPDYSMRIARGTWRHFSYNGPLGTGFMDNEAIISITHFDNVTVGYTTYHGHANYRQIYTITSGPYGAGTLEGVSILEFDYDSKRTPKVMQWGHASFHSGTGDLKGIRMVYTTYTDAAGKLWSTGEVILP